MRVAHHDEHPHRGGGRRVHPAFRRRAPARRPRVAGANLDTPATAVAALAVTDCNVLLGRSIGLPGSLAPIPKPLDRDAVVARFTAMADWCTATGHEMTPDNWPKASQIAVGSMAEAIKRSRYSAVTT